MQSSIHASARSRVGVDRGELPVPVDRFVRGRPGLGAVRCGPVRPALRPPARAPARGARPAPEAQVRQAAGQAQQVGEVLVGLLVRAAAPHELEERDKREQVVGGGGRKEVGYAFDEVQGARGGLRAGESQQREDPVDVHHQQGPARRGALFSFHTGSHG